MYGKEADLCLRARRLGCRPMITPEAEIMHLVGAASSSGVEKRIMVTKARVTLIRNHWPFWRLPLGIALLWLWGALRYTATQVPAPVIGERGRERATYWAEICGRWRDWLQGHRAAKDHGKEIGGSRCRPNASEQMLLLC
jgi:GT2 family glycosyltransferase